MSITGVFRSSLNKVVLAVARFRSEETGATAVEYGIMVALIAAVIVSVVLLLGQEIRDTFDSVLKTIQGSTP